MYLLEPMWQRIMCFFLPFSSIICFLYWWKIKISFIWLILTTSVVQHISRSEEWVLSAIAWRRKPRLTLCVLLFSVGWTTATLCSLTPTVIRCTGCKKFETTQRKLIFAKADISTLDHCSSQLHWLPVKDRIIGSHFFCSLFRLPLSGTTLLLTSDTTVISDNSTFLSKSFLFTSACSELH